MSAARSRSWPIRLVGAAVLLAAASMAHAAPFGCKRGSFVNEQRWLSHRTLPAADTPTLLAPAPAGEIEKLDRLQYVSERYRKLETLDGYFDTNCVTAFIVLKDGKIVHERYLQGRRPGDKLFSASLSKTLTAMAVGVALDEGRLRLDEKVSSILPDLSGSAFADDTIEDLLRMTSAAALTESYSDTTARNGDNMATNVQVSRNTDIRRFLSTKTARHGAPGQRFSYNGVVTAVLAEVLAARYGAPLSSLFAQRIWGPARPESDAHWITNAYGQEGAQCCFHATLRDYARLADVLASRGMAGDQRVLSESFVRAMASVNPAKGVPPSARQYGYQVWIPGTQMPGSTVIEMAGTNGQYIAIDIQRRIVIAHMGNAASENVAFRDWPGLRFSILDALRQ